MSTESVTKVPHFHAEVIKQWADGAPIQWREHDREEWMSCNQDPAWFTHYQYRVKPEPPAKVYPETQMETEALWEVFRRPAVPIGALTNVANAALRHAIDADQVVSMAEVQEVARNLSKRRYERAERALLAAGFEDLGGQEWKPPLGKAPHFIEVRNPTRDMAIANEAAKAAYNAVRSNGNERKAYWELNIDLATIIAKVAP